MVLLLGSAMQSPLADRLRELARAYDPGADEARISAEVFLFNKYLLVQACVGVFPAIDVEYVVGGLVAALNERAGDLALSPDRQQAMEQVWLVRVGEFEPAFARDLALRVKQVPAAGEWLEIITQFCRNIRKYEHPPDIWAGAGGPSHRAGRSVTEEFDRMCSALGELKRHHVDGAA